MTVASEIDPVFPQLQMGLALYPGCEDLERAAIQLIVANGRPSPLIGDVTLELVDQEDLPQGS